MTAWQPRALTEQTVNPHGGAAQEESFEAREETSVTVLQRNEVRPSSLPIITASKIHDAYSGCQHFRLRYLKR